MNEKERRERKWIKKIETYN